MKIASCLFVSVLFSLCASAEWHKPLVANLFDLDNDINRAYGDTRGGTRVWLYLKKSRSGRISMWITGPGLSSQCYYRGVKLGAFLDGQPIAIDGYETENRDIFIRQAKHWVTPLSQAETFEVTVQYQSGCSEDVEYLHFNVGGVPRFNY